MRCRNCGWSNPAGSAKCEKCATELTATPPPVPSAPDPSPMQSTVRESNLFGGHGAADAPSDNAQTGRMAQPTCPRCGYPVSPRSSSCPNCGHVLGANPVTAPESPGANAAAQEAPARPIERAGMGTVMGGPVSGPGPSTNFCTLRPLPWQGEEVQYQPVTYSGDEIVLNRANTDANNNSITSRQQAVLTCEDGEWYIENRSDLRTTFLRVNGKVKLQRGDIIVLGNREFEFKG